MKKIFLRKILTAICGMTFLFVVSSSQIVFAASNIDIDNDIRNQQKILEDLNKQKLQKLSDSYNRNLETLQRQIAELGNFDAAGAVDALALRLNTLESNLDKQIEIQTTLLKEIKQIKSADPVRELANRSIVSEPTAKYVMNPGPSPSGHIQDAANAQGDAKMIFAYGSTQIYKVYCKVGYLTDLEFKEGEEILYVGGGASANWMLDQALVGKTPHLYVKPINDTSTTNLIVNTTNHTYQIIVESGNWYNPMVAWSYGVEEQLARKHKKESDERIYTASMNISNPDQLNFKYKVKGKANWAPEMVFDDGKKTYIKFKTLNDTLPIMMIKEKNKKNLSLVNYRVKDSYYIVDKIFKQAELKANDGSTIQIIMND